MGIFGWSYPPGAASDPAAPYNQEDPPCAVCGNFEAQCICPECPECGALGDPRCYVDPERKPRFHELHITYNGTEFWSAQCDACGWIGRQWSKRLHSQHEQIDHILKEECRRGHGLLRSPEQVASLAAAETRWAADNAGIDAQLAPNPDEGAKR